MAQFIKQLYKLTVLETIHTEYCPLVTQQQVQNNCMWIGTRKMYMYLHNTLQIKFIETYLRIQYIEILKAHTILTIQPVVTVETNASVF